MISAIGIGGAVGILLLCLVVLVVWVSTFCFYFVE